MGSRSRNLDLTQRLMLILGMGITATDTGLMAMDTIAIDTMDTMERDQLMKLPPLNLAPMLMLKLILGTDITAMPTGLMAMDTTDTVLMDMLTGVKSMPSTTSLPTLL